MFQPRSINGIPEGSPPPIPPRNPLRNDAPHLEKEYPLPPQDDDGAAMSQGRPTLHMIAESSLENVDTCLEFASPRHANKEAMLDGPSLRRGPQPDRAPHRLSVMSDDGESASLVSVRSSWTNGLRRLSSVLDGRTAPSVQNPGIGSKMQHNIEQAMANLQSKLVDAESLTTISSYDGGSTLENINNNDEENTRIKAWLQRGTMDGQSLPSACTSQTDGTPKSPATKNPPAISIFPPMSPNTGKREYICPSSPLNNGRDAYGNYIPTNTQDYMTARHIPSSPQSPFDVEDTCSYGQDSTSAARLRGGGGWWNALGIGFDEKESSEVKQNELAASEASRKQTPVQSLRVKRYFGSPSQYSGKTPSDGGGSYVGTALVREMSDTTSHQPLRPMLANNHHNPRSTAGHILNDHSLTTDLTPQYTSPRTHGNDNHAPASPRQRPWPSYDAHASSAYPSASKAFPKVSKTAESPWSGVSFTPRANKKWNQEPASGPPSSVVMPPPPLVQHTYTDSDVVSSVGMLSPSKYRYERQPSLAESYDDQAWELQSLQLGESVSVAGGPRRTVGGMSRPRTARFDPEEFEAAQKIAQVEFRPLCQDIMTRYNAEMSRNQRELKEGRMTAEQYKRQMDFLVQNKDRSLKHSAESTGYVILTSEFSILESLSSPDSYAIYHDLLSTTDPSLWRSLVQQHHELMAQTMHSPSSVVSRTSSLDQARHVAGKIARFVLAAPSDPELKTHSTRTKKKAEGSEEGLGIVPLAWMDPLAVAGLTGLAGQEEGIAMGEAGRGAVGRGKGEMKSPMTLLPETDGHDFAIRALPAQSRITGTTAVPSTTKQTGTTACLADSSYQARPIQAKIQQAYRPIERFPGRRDPPTRNGSEVAATDVSQQSMWPQGDSEGNWWVPKGLKGLRLRGGKGKDKKEKKEKKKLWLEGWRAEAMYVNGSI